MKSKTARVLQFMDFGANYPGNFMRSILSLGEALEKEGGVQVLLLPPRAKGKEWAQKLARENGAVYFFSGNPIKDASLLRSIVKKHKINVIHTHFLHGKNLLALSLFKAIKPGAKIIVHLRSGLKSSPSALKKLYYRLFIRASATLSVSSGVAAQQSYAYGGKSFVVYDALDFSRLEKYEELKKEDYLAPGSEKLALMFGYDFEIKGIDVMLRSLEKYDSEHKITLLVAVANHRDKAEKQLSEMFGKTPKWVKLLPPRDDIASYYRIADAFVSASRREGLPFALMEAAWCGVPSVSSDIPGPNELKVPYIRLFPSEDEKALYEAVSALVSLTEEEKSKQAAEKKEYAEKNFSLASLNQRIMSAYDTVLGNK